MHPAGHRVLVTQTERGPVGNFMLYPVITLSGREITERRREAWPEPTALEPDVYTLCYRREGSGAWLPQSGGRNLVVAADQVRVVSHLPTAVFPGINAEIALTAGPTADGDGGAALSPGDWVALRDAELFETDNCTAVRRAEVQQVSANMSIASGALEAGKVYRCAESPP